jgi:hypothetical protein
MMRCKIIRQRRYREGVQKKNEEKNKEAALVAGGKQLHDKAAVQITFGES